MVQLCKSVNMADHINRIKHTNHIISLDAKKHSINPTSIHDKKTSNKMDVGGIDINIQAIYGKPIAN